MKPEPLRHFLPKDARRRVLPSRPMSRWICLLLLACASAHAAPNNAPSDDLDRLVREKTMLSQLQEARHNVQDKAGEVVATAMGFLGVPYRRGGNDVETGFDCSGFIRTIYGKAAGLVLPRRADQQAAATEKIEKKDLQPGDLVFFNTMRRAFSHVGMYVGDGKFIHSPRSGAEVRVEDMGASYWQRRFNGARRVSTDDTGKDGSAN
ncbi:C40 family peptidase [Acidovorax sp. SUPP1855]|nr:C40 family peptidase [Acidovorax sp. SUPP1855]